MADRAAGLRIIDVSNPNSPSEIGYYVFPDVDPTGEDGEYLDLQVIDDYFYTSASDGYGLYVLQYDESVDVSDFECEDKFPSEFHLSQNYPNPFNPQTTIEYKLPKSCHVTLKIFNSLGQEIVTLIDQEQKAGDFKVQWNAQGLTTGLYLYQLEAEGFSKVRKMLVLQ